MISTQGRGPVRRWRQAYSVIGVVAVAGLFAAACTAGSPSGAQQAAHGGHGGTDAAAQLGQGAAAPGEHGDMQARTQPGDPAADAAIQLQALLGHHSIVAAEMMRARIRGDEDFALSANAALGKNTDAMTDLVKTLLGEAPADRFRSMWTGHVTALFDYSLGLVRKDGEARNQAQTTLNAFEDELAAFFADGAQGRLPKDAANAAVDAHVQHLLQQADEYASGDYAKSNGSFREAYAHTYEIGKVLAVALLGPDQAAALDKPTWRLRSELTKLLGEHVVLAVAATRAGVTNAPDFAAAADAVNANTADLAAAIDALFGDAAAKSFVSLWGDHLEQVMAYTAGVVAKDDARRDQAVAELAGFEEQFAEFLGSATGNRIAGSDLAAALAMHDDRLIRQVQAFAAKDYPAAHDTAYSTYEHMRDLAGQLADAFGETVAARLPTGGPATGGGGMADVVGRR